MDKIDTFGFGFCPLAPFLSFLIIKCSVVYVGITPLTTGQRNEDDTSSQSTITLPIPNTVFIIHL